MKDLKSRCAETNILRNSELYPPFPSKNLLIEVTNACNLKCIFCANRKMTRKRQFISPDTVKKVLTEAYALGTREVGFYSTGEPLLCKQLPLYISLAKKIGFDYVYITTNGILASTDIVENLANCGMDSIKFSINAIDPKSYLFIHGYDYYDAVMEHLIQTYKLRQDNDYTYKIFVSYIATKYTFESIEAIRNHFIKYCDDVVVLNTINQSGLTPEVGHLLRCDSNNFSVNIELATPCNLLFNSINVTSEGYLTACCADFQNYLVYADLNKTSLKEAWHNDTIVDFRKKHIEGDVCGSLCDNCINNLLSAPAPLNKDVSTPFSEHSMFSEAHTLERINQYISEA